MLFIYNQAHLQPGDLLLYDLEHVCQFCFDFHMQNKFKIPKNSFFLFSNPC